MNTVAQNRPRRPSPKRPRRREGQAPDTGEMLAKWLQDSSDAVEKCRAIVEAKSDGYELAQLFDFFIGVLLRALESRIGDDDDGVAELFRRLSRTAIGATTDAAREPLDSAQRLDSGLDLLEDVRDVFAAAPAVSDNAAVLSRAMSVLLKQLHAGVIASAKAGGHDGVLRFVCRAFESLRDSASPYAKPRRKSRVAASEVSHAAEE